MQLVKEFFDQLAPSRDKWAKKNSYYYRDLFSFLKFVVPSDSSVLEIGCATGNLLAAVSPRKGMGIDFSSKMIEVAKEKYPSYEFKEMSVENMFFSEKFDYIILADTVGYLDDIQKAFLKIKEICHPKTKLVITFYSYLWQPILKLAEKLHLKKKLPLQNWLSPQDIDNFLSLAGFEVVKNGHRMLIPKYIPLISTLFNRYVAKLPFFRKLCVVNYVVARPTPEKSGGFSASDHTVTVVIPARNEQGNIESALKRMPKFGSHLEIIFVEGNSTDDTWGKIERVQKTYPDLDIKIMKQDGRGKGDAVRKGFDAATGDILMILDADLTVRPEELPKFYSALVSGSGEFINGSRLVYPLSEDSMRILNILGNKFFSLMFSWLLDTRIKDTLCGTKVLWKEDYKKIKQGRSFFGEFDPFGDFDLLFGAFKINLKIVDLPIRYQARVYGETNISRFSQGWLLLKMCFFAMKKIKFI